MNVGNFKTGQVRDIFSRYQTFLIDNWGVLRCATRPFHQAYATLRELQIMGKRIMIFSNTCGKLPAEVKAELKANGVEITEDQIITSGMVLKRAFKLYDLVGKKTICLGNEALREYVRQAGGIVHRGRDAAAVVFGDVISEETFRDYEVAHKLAQLGRPVFIPNPDRWVPVEIEDTSSSRSSGPGYQGEIFEAATGAKMIVLGKPSPLMYIEAAEKLRGCKLNEVLVVGDSLDHDILGANNAGLASFMTLSGNHAIMPRSLEDIGNSQVAAALFELMAKQGTFPIYLAAFFDHKGPLFDMEGLREHFCPKETSHRRINI